MEKTDKSNAQRWLLYLLLLVGILLLVLYLNVKINTAVSYYKNGGFERKVDHLNLTLERNDSLSPDTYTILGRNNKNLVLHGLKSHRLFVVHPVRNNPTRVIELRAIVADNDEITSISLDTTTHTISLFSAPKQRCYILDENGNVIRSITLPFSFSRASRTGDTFVFMEDRPGYRSQLSKYIYDSTTEKMEQVGTYTGIFGDKYALAVDGSLSVSGDHTVHVSYYTNRISFADKGFIFHQASTIDTITTFPDVHVNSEKGIVSYGSPQRLVNGSHQLLRHDLIVRSYISSNEGESLAGASILDVYDLNKNGNYKYSHIISGIKNQQPQDIFLTPDRLYISYSGNLLVYKR